VANRAKRRRLPEPLLFFGLLLISSGCVGDPIQPPLDTGVVDGDADADIAGDAEADALLDADDDEQDSDADLQDSDVDDGRLCPANNDGVLQRAEVLVSFDAALVYRAPPRGQQVPVELAGTMEDETLTWHFEAPVAGERVLEEQATSIEGTWFEEEFPSATHVAPLSEAHGYDGVYQLDDDALWLLGFVSQDDEGTRVTYDPPVPLLRFPLAVGDTWTVTTTGSGWMSGFMFYDTEEYRLTADAAGVVVVPAGRFPVIRVRSEVTQTIGLLQTRRIAYSFMAECWGRVAQVASRDNERELEFEMATDYRRLAYE
jgi:hypothetical protein